MIFSPGVITTSSGETYSLNRSGKPDLPWKLTSLSNNWSLNTSEKVLNDLIRDGGHFQPDAPAVPLRTVMSKKRFKGRVSSADMSNAEPYRSGGQHE